MKIILHILILFLTSSLLLPQDGTFDRSYSSLNEGYQILEYPDGGYVVAGIFGPNFFIMRTDNRGEIIFSKTLESDLVQNYSFRTLPIEITATGDILFGGGVRINNSIFPYVVKLNNSGEKLWEKYFPQFGDFIGTDITVGEDGKIYLITIKRDFSSEHHLLKLGSNGDLLWSKSYSITPSFLRYGYSIENLPDNNFLLALNKNVYKISPEGDVLWKYDSDYRLNVIKSSVDNSIITSGDAFISKIDSGGSILWKKEFPGRIESMDITNNNEIVFVLEGKKVIKLNGDGEVLREINIREFAYYINSTESGEILITGYIQLQGAKRLRITKTDSEGFYNAFDLIYLASKAYENSGIYWFAKGADFVDIDYSRDDGLSWNRIASNFPADSGYYDWQTPEEMLIRIKNSFNPDQFVITKCDLYGSTVDMYDYIAVNDVLMWISNNGDGSHDPMTDGNGFYWPGGKNATQSASFEDGLVYGGKVEGILSVNGNTHRQGLIGGSILPNGIGDDPYNQKYKIYKINKDWESLPDGPAKTRLTFDYENWPGEYGAPWEDVNGNGIFEKGIDQPQFIGDEVLFYVANDTDEKRASFTYGSFPLGLEFQTTIYGYAGDGFLKDVVFKRYRIINKNRELIEDMYLSFWTDDDMGDAGDDFVGCDTTLNLGFTYNGEEFDYIYGAAPPAVGHMVVQGPIKEGTPQDRAMFKGKWINGFKNISMNAFTFYIGGSALFSDPYQGVHEGAEMFYNNMQGLVWNGDSLKSTDFYHVPLENEVFWLSGDPVNNTGWYEGLEWPNGFAPDDRRYLMSFGPFNFAPADTQEIVFAIFMGQGTDRLNSVTELKKTGRKIHEYYQNEIISGNITSAGQNREKINKNYVLHQNYPNPFNPTTKIKYEIPNMRNAGTRNAPTSIQFGHPAKLDVGTCDDLNTIHSNADVWTSDDLNKSKSNGNSEGHHMSLPQIHVKLIVYDILGREIKTLVNENQSPGIYEIEFNAESMASGIYIYRIQVGEFVATKKMVLLR